MPLNEQIVSDLAARFGLPEVLDQFRSTETPADGVNPFADKINGLQVFTAAQLTERIGNETRSAVDKATNDTKGNTYGAMDKRILEETGVAKNTGEKTVDYLVRAAKEKFGTKANESEEMTRLRQDLTAKDTLLTQKTEEFDTYKSTVEQQQTRGQIDRILDSTIATLPLDVPADRLDAQRRFLKYELEQKYDISLVGGKLEFKDKATGEIKRDGTTASPMQADALIPQFAPSVVSLKTSQRNGTGVKPAVSTPTTADDLAAFATIDDYKKHLTESGITLASADGQQKLQAYIDHRKAQTT